MCKKGPQQSPSKKCTKKCQEYSGTIRNAQKRTKKTILSAFYCIFFRATLTIIPKSELASSYGMRMMPLCAHRRQLPALQLAPTSPSPFIALSQQVSKISRN